MHKDTRNEDRTHLKKLTWRKPSTSRDPAADLKVVKH